MQAVVDQLCHQRQVSIFLQCNSTEFDNEQEAFFHNHLYIPLEPPTNACVNRSNEPFNTLRQVRAGSDPEIE